MTDIELSENNWSIIDNINTGPPKTIINRKHPIKIDPVVYNYEVYTPVVLAPINRTSTLVVSAYDLGQGKGGLRIHDLRLVDDQIASSISFTLRGNNYQIRKLKSELVRVADSDRCIGISFLLRKIFYAGFRTIYADKKLRPKTVSPMGATMRLISSTMDQQSDTLNTELITHHESILQSLENEPMPQKLNIDDLTLDIDSRIEYVNCKSGDPEGTLQAVNKGTVFSVKWDGVSATETDALIKMTQLLK